MYFSIHSPPSVRSGEVSAVRVPAERVCVPSVPEEPVQSPAVPVGRGGSGGQGLYGLSGEESLHGRLQSVPCGGAGQSCAGGESGLWRTGERRKRAEKIEHILRFFQLAAKRRQISLKTGILRYEIHDEQS